MNVREVLVEARAIQAQGHLKGLLQDGRGNHCMRGSIMAATDAGLDLDSWSLPLVMEAERVLVIANGWHAGDRSGFGWFDAVPEMNNAPATTLEDALGWFDKAIAHAHEFPMVSPPRFALRPLVSYLPIPS